MTQHAVRVAGVDPRGTSHRPQEPAVITLLLAGIMWMVRFASR